MFDKNCLYWCDECETLSYLFLCCGNSICNAGGCPDCSPIHKEISRRVHEIEDKVDIELLKRAGTLKIEE